MASAALVTLLLAGHLSHVLLVRTQRGIMEQILSDADP